MNHVSRLEDLDRLYAVVKEKHGHIDVLFANAGAGRRKIIATNKPFKDDWVFAITVRNGKLTNIREYVDTQALARASEMDASPGTNPSKPMPHEAIRKVS